MKHFLSFVLFISIHGLLLAQNGITEKQFLSHETYLSSDKLEGRFPGTKGNNKAARYISKQFKQLHLKQWNKRYKQPFSLFIKPHTNSVSKDTVQTQNIVGYLEGNDSLLKNEYIVIGAHYDHLGWGGQGTGSKTPLPFITAPTTMPPAFQPFYALLPKSQNNSTTSNAALFSLHSVAKKKG